MKKSNKLSIKFDQQSTSKSKKVANSSKNALLIFPDGEIFYGNGIGIKSTSIGEICFNTSITGYQEILSDPSYSSQIITFTFPHIGNVGVNDKDIESKTIKAKGLVIRENITNPANYRSNQHLNQWLINNKITGISGVDTRAITKKIRTSGAKNVALIYLDDITKIEINKIIDLLNQSKDLNGVELASIASENKNYNWQDQGIWHQKSNNYNQLTNNKFRVVAIDFGAKLNILRCLKQIGFEVMVVGAKTSYDEIMSYHPDGIFLSNGPGDPAQTAKYFNQVLVKIIKANIPLFGICLGHQLLAHSLGARTIKMHQGHRGANHPVKNLATNKVEITSQNHGFCVDKESLPDNVEITHISLFDNTIEGIKIKNGNAFSVQYHPESSPGPNDSFYLFEEFYNMILKSKK